MHSCPSLHDTLTTEHVQSCSSPPPLSLLFFEVLEVSSPLLSLCLFLPPTIWSLTPPLHLAEGVNEGRGHPSSPPPLLLNWMLVASVDICRQLSPPLLRAGVQTRCSFVAFLSLQPQACLPRKSKRETLIINSAKVIAVTTPICRLQHKHTLTFFIPQLPQTPGGKKSVIRMRQHFYNSERRGKSLQFLVPRQKKLTN